MLRREGEGALKVRELWACGLRVKGKALGNKCVQFVIDP